MRWSGWRRNTGIRRRKTKRRNIKPQTQIPDWDTLWKDKELREDFAAAVRMNEEWIKQTDWLKASAPIGRIIQRHDIDEHFENSEDVMTRWAKHFAPRNKHVR